MSTIWQSSITSEMVKDLNPNELEVLVADLDDAVMLVCQDFGLEG